MRTLDKITSGTHRLKRILIWFLIIWLGLVLLMNLGFLAYSRGILYLVPAFLFFCGLNCLKFYNPINDLQWIFFLFILSFFTKLIVSLLIQTSAISDFKVMNDAAISFSQQDYTFSQSTYFTRWAYQTGYVSYAGIVYQLFGENQLVLKALNCLFMAGVNVMVYLMAKRIASEKAARFMAILYLCYPANLFLTPVLTNQHLSLFLLYLGINIYLKYPQRAWGLVCAGMVTALSKVIRPDAIIFIASVLFVGFFDCMQKIKDKANLFLSIKRVACFILAYALMLNMVSGLVKVSGINPNGLENKDPLWKFVVGLNHNTYGVFSEADYDRYFKIENDELRKDEELKAIKSRVFNIKLPVTFIVKQGLLWADFEDTYWGFHQLYSYDNEASKLSLPPGSLLEAFRRFDKGYYILILGMLGVSLYSLLKKKREEESMSLAVLLFVILFFVFVSVYTLIEVQVRYRYLIMPILFVLAAMGYDKVGGRFPFKKRSSMKH